MSAISWETKQYTTLQYSIIKTEGRTFHKHQNYITNYITLTGWLNSFQFLLK